MTLSFIYNMFLGFIDPVTFGLIWQFLSNQPKGSGYEVPASEAGFNFMLGIIVLMHYLVLFLPLNIFMKKKANVILKTYSRINGIATAIGIVIALCIYGHDLI